MGECGYWQSFNSSGRSPPWPLVYQWSLDRNPFDFGSITYRLRFKWEAMSRLRFKWNAMSTFNRAAANRIAVAVEKLVHEKRIEIFDMEETQGWASAVIGRVSIPVVIRLHGPWFINGPLISGNVTSEDRVRIRWEGQALRSAAGILAPSNNILELSQKHYGPFKNQTEIIPNPIPAIPSQGHWKYKNCERALILFVGRFDYLKGADIVLKAYAKIAQQFAAARLIFVGHDGGFETGNEHRLKIADFVANYIPAAARGRVEYLGVLTDSEIDKLRLRANLCVISSRYETFGNTVVEAMARGCPIVATEVGGIPEIVSNERNGLLVPANNFEALATAITRMIKDNTLATRLGAQAANDCRDRFAPEVVGLRTIEFYARVRRNFSFSSRSEPLGL